MIVFHVVARQLTLVALALVIKRVGREVLLQNDISFVYLVLKHIGNAHVGNRPALGIDPFLNPSDGHVGEEVAVNPAHYRRLILLDDEGLAVPAVAESRCVPLFTTLEFLLYRPPDVGGNGLALFLGEAREDGKHEKLLQCWVPP